ncbi:hypothetical protein [Amycolatopsis sp. NPDC098790]|uniref:hypothetical protein n=1 Tax=Amycolatopsis sp. NPDC098790 TaxID=3363939 RepID=UPI00380F99A2
MLRARHRVLAAMHNQATQQGRYLGGRPPYGYQLVDAGPHPNPADARWGRRLQRLAPDPRASSALLIRGQVQAAEGVVTLVADRIEALDLSMVTAPSRDFR